MKLTEAILYVYNKYKATEHINNQFFLYSFLADYCNDSIEEKEKLNDFKSILLKINVFQLVDVVNMEELIVHLKLKYDLFKDLMDINRYKQIVFEFVKALDINCYQKHLKVKSKPQSLVQVKNQSSNKKIKKDLFVQSNGELISYRGRKKVVVVPSNIKKIRANAFANNSHITCIILRSVEVIDSKAFCDMPNLKAVFIGDNIKSIKSFAFNNTPKTTVYFEGDDYTKRFRFSKDWDLQGRVLGFAKRVKHKFDFYLWDFYMKQSTKILGQMFS